MKYKGKCKDNKKTYLSNDTNKFIEGVVERCNEIYRNSGLVVYIDLENIKENVKKKKNKISKPSVVEVINLKDDEDIIQDEDVQIISMQEYHENLLKSDAQVDPNRFSCVICYRNKIKMSTRKYPCGHEFCNDCATAWLRLSNKCPICRETIYNW